MTRLGKHLPALAALFALATTVLSFDQTFAWNSTPIVETRSLDEIHQAALKEGGNVILWHGGSDASQLDGLKKAFENRFPGMTLNVSVKSSSYLGPDLDRQLVTENLYVDNVMLQTAQDYPRWRDDGALLNYKTDGFDQVYNAFKDDDGAWASYAINAWSIVYNNDKLNGTSPPTNYLDFLKPEFKNRIVVTYPNADDAVLHTFDLIMRRHGLDFFEALLTQNPLWVNDAGIPASVIAEPNNTYALTFTTSIGLVSKDPLMVQFPTEGAQFTSWAQRSAIFRAAPHPESAKLVQSYVLSKEYQEQTGSWSVRRDVGAPDGYLSILETPNTDPIHFQDWMNDRSKVERLRFWFQDKVGYPTE